MYRLTNEQRRRQGLRLKNVDCKLVTGFLRTSLAFIAAHPEGPLPFIVEGFRTAEQQAKNYAQGRTTPGEIITTKQAGHSKHELSPAKAIDIGFLDDSGNPDYSEPHYKEFYELWKLHSTEFTWGGTWRNPHDPPHFEIA